MTGDSDGAWDFWVKNAFGCDLPVSPYRVATTRACNNTKRNNNRLFALMRNHRRVLAAGHHNGWTEDLFSQHEHFTNCIARLLADGRKEALADWRHSMCNLGSAAKWLRDGLDVPATICADPVTPTAKGEQIREEWLPHWTQPPDESQRIQGIAQQLHQLPIRYNILPWSPSDPWTTDLILHHCRNSAPGLDGFGFNHFAALDKCFLEMLCEIFNAFDNGLPFPHAWSHARLVCLAKPDGGTRPITVLATAYRIWASRTAQLLADWTSWFPDELVGGRPHGPRAADSANHVSSILADKHATNTFQAGACLDVSKCFDSISLQGIRLLLDRTGAPQFLYNVVNLWQSLQRHVWFDAEPTGVVIQSPLPRGIPQGDPLAPWTLNLIMATWICNLPPLPMVKVFLDDRCMLHNNLAEFSMALSDTYHFDWCFGLTANRGKSSRFYVGPLPAGPFDSIWFELPLAISVKYLGTMLETHPCMPMQLGNNRAKRVKQKVQRARLLPDQKVRHQLLTSFLQGLYADAALASNRSLDALEVAIVQAWWGPTLHPKNTMRSRAVTLGLFNPLHLVSPLIAMCYGTLLSLARLQARVPTLARSIWISRYSPWQKL